MKMLKKMRNICQSLKNGYIKDKLINIRDCQNLGIEEVSDLDKIYDERLKYKNK